MKVVILSDLNWHDHLRDMTLQDAISFEEEQLYEPAYERIARYFAIIIAERADLVLFSGDITGDGSCGHGFHHALLALLQLLENRRIPSAFINGNHDPNPYWKHLRKRTTQLQYTRSINNKLEIIGGLKILGIDFYCTKSKPTLKELLAKHQSSDIDICIAHSEIKRRIRLFDTAASLIVTGHYDRKIFPFRQSTFISLDNDSAEVSYATALFEGHKLVESRLCIRQDVNRLIYVPSSPGNPISPHLHSEGQAIASFAKLEAAHKSSFMDKEGSDWTYIKYMRGTKQREAYESLFAYKQTGKEDPELRPLSQVRNLRISPGYKISGVFIEDYIGRHTSDKD